MHRDNKLDEGVAHLLLGVRPDIRLSEQSSPLLSPPHLTMLLTWKIHLTQRDVGSLVNDMVYRCQLTVPRCLHVV